MKKLTFAERKSHSIEGHSGPVGRIDLWSVNVGDSVRVNLQDTDKLIPLELIVKKKNGEKYECEIAFFDYHEPSEDFIIGQCESFGGYTVGDIVEIEHKNIFDLSRKS